MYVEKKPAAVILSQQMRYDAAAPRMPFAMRRAVDKESVGPKCQWPTLAANVEPPPHRVLGPISVLQRLR